jgi:hypothetical protein
MTEYLAGQVECYSGHTYAQEPRAVIWHGRRYPVTVVRQRWRTQRGPAFWLETETGERFEVHYTEETDTWTVRPLLPDDEAVHQASTSRTEVHYNDKEVPAR